MFFKSSNITFSSHVFLHAFTSRWFGSMRRKIRSFLFVFLHLAKENKRSLSKGERKKLCKFNCILWRSFRFFSLMLEQLSPSYFKEKNVSVSVLGVRPLIVSTIDFEISRKLEYFLRNFSFEKTNLNYKNDWKA